MNSTPSVALLISTYNWPEALELVLESIVLQKVLPFEILIADDGSGPQTAFVIESFSNRLNVPIKHIWHEDTGFRKTIILNKAIRASVCDYIIQIDGDIILHPSFIQDHILEAERGCYIKGSRTLLSEKRTEVLLKKKATSISVFSKGQRNRFNSFYMPLLAPLLRVKRKRSHDFRGCNCAFWKSDFVEVNGYNNSLSGWGHEDIELAARFINAGCIQKRIKLKAVCYHLHHGINVREQESENYAVYLAVVKNGTVKTANGYKQVVI